jgi:phenylacetate-CoA ligase
MPSVFPRPPRPMRWARRMLLGERVVALSGKDLPLDEFVRCSRTAAPRGYVVRGYAAYLTRLAWRLLEAGMTLPAPPRVVISGGETLTELDAGTIERALGCKVVNHYAAWEVPHMAQTCPDNPALLHVNSERVVVRVLTEDCRPADPGARGRIVVTSLENYVMPFINYEIGDWGIAGAPCPCGRGFPTLTKVEGRLGETIRTPSGRLISPVTLDGVFRFRGPYVREYQAERTAADTLTVRVVPTPRFTPEIASTLGSELAQYVGTGMKIRVETVAGIPAEPSGKRLIIRPPAERMTASPGTRETVGSRDDAGVDGTSALWTR